MGEDIPAPDGLEPISQPIYFTATYPRDGTGRLSFFTGRLSFFEEEFDPAICNLRKARMRNNPYCEDKGPMGDPYYHLPWPQYAYATGLALRPVYSGDDWKIVRAYYARLRESAVFQFHIGCKIYEEGPLDHLLSLEDPTPQTNIDKFWNLKVSDGPLKVLHIPSCQTFRLDVIQRDGPIKLPIDLKLRAYIIGTTYREVS